MRTRTTVAAVFVCAGAAGCRALPPPPILAPHAAITNEREGATTAMLVLGIANEWLLGADAWGVALRVERQQTDRTTTGLELSGGRGDQAYFEDRSMFRHWLVGVRGYGRFAPQADGLVALTSGVGLSVTASGLVTGTLHVGAAIAYDNAYAVPVGTLGAALAVPLRRGRAFAAPTMTFSLGPPDPTIRPERPRYLRPRTELFLAFGGGLVVPVGETGNRLSVDLTVARALRDRSSLVSLSVADGHRLVEGRRDTETTRDVDVRNTDTLPASGFVRPIR